MLLILLLQKPVSLILPDYLLQAICFYDLQRLLSGLMSGCWYGMGKKRCTGATYISTFQFISRLQCLPIKRLILKEDG